MKIPEHITIKNSAYAADGGSACLDAVDDFGQRVSVVLWWSTTAVRANTTSLTVNEEVVEKRSEDEARVIAMLKSAREIRVKFIGWDGEVREACPLDGAKYIVKKVLSDIHIHGFDPDAGMRKLKEDADRVQKGIVACRSGEYAAAIELFEAVTSPLSPVAKGYLDRARRKLAEILTL